MSKKRLHVFCSDVHLLPGGGEITRRFIRFLESIRDRDDVIALHIIGDLFEYWLGVGHELRPDYQEVFKVFKDLSESCEINFLFGNRDFLVYGAEFEARTGIIIRGETHKFEVAGQKIKLMHGDHLCTQDIGYQRFRRFIRSLPILTATRYTSIGLKRSVARWLRSKSKKSTSKKSMVMMDFAEAAVVKMFSDCSDVAVCGHIHREHTRPVEHPSGRGQLYVLGAWHEESPFLIVDEKGQFQFGRDKVDMAI